MPFGLANASANFQSYINKCLAEKLDVSCIVYLDDILIYTSEKEAKHEKAVRWVLEQLQKYVLYAKLKKCFSVLMRYIFGGIFYRLQGYIWSRSELKVSRTGRK